MCGIAGVFDFNGRAIDARALLAMSDAQAHRGPDGKGVMFVGHDGKVRESATARASEPLPAPDGTVGGLAHRRLSIIDLSDSGAQPMSDAWGECWITFNGEIYNYLELRTELAQRGYPFRSRSDTEVILAAYREWGHDCVLRLNGMFAFAIWDARAQQLFCARDHLGIKPFCYCFAGGRFQFASEQKALLAGNSVPARANLEAVVDYLSFSYTPSTDTLFQGIQKLAPGHSMVADRRGLQVQCFWNPDFGGAAPRNEESWAEELRELVRDAIRLQIRSDVPVGAHLSGGIDSSTVCCFAAELLPKLQTFTAKFEEGGLYDESAFARMVVDRIHSDHHEVIPRRGNLPELLPKVLFQLDEPVEAASVFGKYHVAEIVSTQVKVVLGGQGGDELFGGYDWYVKNLFTAMLFGYRPQAPSGWALRFLWATMKEQSAKRLVKSVWRNFGNNRLDHIFANNWNRAPGAADLLRAGATHGDNAEARFLAAFGALGESELADRMFKFDMQHYLQALLTSEDRLSMAFSVESRVPLLDYRIAELAGRLGWRMKSDPGVSKRVLRQAAEGVVPAQILARRDKRGFPTPIGQWLRDPALNLMERFVYRDNAFAKEYFDLDRLRTLERSTSYFSTDWSERLWRVLTVCVWAKVFKLT